MGETMIYSLISTKSSDKNVAIERNLYQRETESKRCTMVKSDSKEKQLEIIQDHDKTWGI